MFDSFLQLVGHKNFCKLFNNRYIDNESLLQYISLLVVWIKLKNRKVENLKYAEDITIVDTKR